MEADVIYSYISEGSKQADIAEEYGISQSKVSEIIKSHGFNTRHRTGWSKGSSCGAYPHISKKAVVNYVQNYNGKHSFEEFSNKFASYDESKDGFYNDEQEHNNSNKSGDLLNKVSNFAGGSSGKAFANKIPFDKKIIFILGAGFFLFLNRNSIFSYTEGFVISLIRIAVPIAMLFIAYKVLRAVFGFSQNVKIKPKRSTSRGRATGSVSKTVALIGGVLIFAGFRMIQLGFDLQQVLILLGIGGIMLVYYFKNK